MPPSVSAGRSPASCRSPSHSPWDRSDRPIPTAGGLYHWGSILGGRGLGWLTAWFNLIGLVTVLAAINVGTYLFLVGALFPYLGIDTAALTPASPTVTSVLVQSVIVCLITFSQALFNHRGIRLTSRLTDLSGYLIFGVTMLLIVALLAFAPHLDAGRLVSFKNYSGDAGGGVWPQSGSLVYLFLLGLLLPAYTVTGFDASAHTAEETIGAARAIPRGMIHSVFWSGLIGWIMLSAIVMAAPDLDKAAGQGSGAFFSIMDGVLPAPLKILLYLGIAVSQYLCGLACVTSASRMIFAFARDGGLPGSGALRAINPRFRTPVTAIWTASILSVLFTIYAPVYSTIAAVCTIFLYISYLLPVAAGLLAHRRSWVAMGPFDLGMGYRVAAVVCIIGCAVLIFIGIQPPNDQALTVTLGALVLAAIVWFGLRAAALRRTAHGRGRGRTACRHRGGRTGGRRSMSHRLAGRVALISGGATGCGAAAARIFAEEGASVGIVDRNVEAGAALAEDLRALGHRAVFAEADVSRAAEVERAAAAIAAALGPVTALFNHAGTLIVKPFLDTTEAEWDWLMAVNVKSMFLMTQAVLPGMIAAGGGAIVCTSSISATLATPGEVLYDTTKGACQMFARAIAVEFRDRGIRCNAVCPGFIRTPHGLREVRDLAALGVDVSDAALAAAQGRMCEPEEVARAALFLLSRRGVLRERHAALRRQWVQRDLSCLGTANSGNVRAGCHRFSHPKRKRPGTHAPGLDIHCKAKAYSAACWRGALPWAVVPSV